MTEAEQNEFLQGMVQIDSVSGEEGKVAEWIVGELSGWGFESHVDEAGNAVGIRCGDKPTEGVWRDIVLLGHIDTVPGHIPVRIENGVLHGRGSVDAKGPFATFVMAAAQVRPKPGVRMHVIGAVEEESATSKGARAVLPKLHPELCLIGEPSGADALTLGYKGRVLFDLVFEQDGGHSAGPIGSVGERAFAFWRSIEAYAATYNEQYTALFDQLLPSLRSVQTDSDGLTDTARMTCAFRLPPGFDVDELECQMRLFDPQAACRMYGAESAWSNGRTSAWAKAFNRVWRKSGMVPRFKMKTGTSDMNVLGPHWKCPIAAYGPGDSTLDHTPKERIALKEYAQAIDTLARVLVELEVADSIPKASPTGQGI